MNKVNALRGVEVEYNIELYDFVVLLQTKKTFRNFQKIFCIVFDNSFDGL